jgi:hypothetical protein
MQNSDVVEYNDDYLENFRRVERARVVDESAFENDGLRGFYTWWNSGPATPPTRSKFDIIDHWRFAPNFFVIRVIDPQSFEVALVGDEVVQLVGRNPTGRRFTVDDDDIALRNFAGYLNAVVESRNSWRCTGSLAVFQREHIRFESIDCPLTDPSGRDITHCIGLMMRV